MPGTDGRSCVDIVLVFSCSDTQTVADMFYNVTDLQLIIVTIRKHFVIQLIIKISEIKLASKRRSFISLIFIINYNYNFYSGKTKTSKALCKSENSKQKRGC